MKKLISLAVFAVIVAAGYPIFADEGSKYKHESEYYYVNISLEKIYPYRNGYVVQYRRGIKQMARAYLPMEWFTGSAGKEEVINLPAGKVWPSMSVYYREGEFSHVRLYVHRSPSHQTWGTISQTVNIDSRFENVEDLQLKF